MVYFWGAIIFWILAWMVNVWISRQKENRFFNLVSPVLFGISIILIWESCVVTFNVSPVILPPPSAIYLKFISSIPILWEDFVQTAIKGALSGYIIGCVAAFIVSLIADRFNFLERGLLPIGNFLAAMPIIGIAPILVMWYGYGWQSKAAVVAVMVFFPILVNTVQGLKMSDKIHRDLMQTYNASYFQTMIKLRLSTAMPFIFNGLKICTTLALIGAIVAEFFGTPIVGVGFRISTEVGRMNLDMVWAEITVAALVGTITYGIITFIEKRLTFWHPSIRGN